MPCYRNWEPGGGLHCSSAVRRFDLPLRLHLRSSNKYPCIPEVVPLQTEILPILPAYKEVLSFQEKSSRRHTTKKAEQPHIRIYQARVRHESFNTFTTTEPRETSKRINKNKKGLSETERERWNRTLSKVLRLRSWYNQSSDQTPPTSHKKTPSCIPPMVQPKQRPNPTYFTQENTLLYPSYTTLTSLIREWKTPKRKPQHIKIPKQNTQTDT